MRYHLQLNIPSQFQSVTGWNLTRLIAAAVNLILVASAIIFVFTLLLGGLRFILAARDKEKTQKVTRSIANAFIGLLIVFGTYAIMDLLSNFFGVPLLKFTIISV